MRWKLLRRRLSVSAPRMIVRSHLPWPLRWVAIALVLGFSAALAMWAFEFGREFAGFDRGERLELAQLRLEVERLRLAQEQSQTFVNAADSLIKTERAANERLARELRQLESDKLVLEEDLGFFQRLLPTGGQPLQLRALQADALAPGQIRYQMLVMQGGKNPKEFVGSYDVLLTGSLAGKPWTGRLPDGPRALKLKQYIRVEGLIDHPAQLVLKDVQVRVTDPQGAVRATGSVKMP